MPVIQRFWLRLLLAAAVFLLDALVWGGDTQLVTGGEVPVWLVIAIGVTGYSCLVWTRSPVPGYIAMLVLSASSLLLPAVEAFAGFLLALFWMARLSPRRRAWFALAWAALPLCINIYTGWTFHQDAPVSLAFINTGLWLVFIIGVWIAGRVLARTHHRLTTERQWAEAATEEARAMERVRISRDLHDTVAHALTGIVLQVAGLRAAQKNPAADMDMDAVLDDIQTTAEQSMRELHRLLGVLRTPEYGDADSRPHVLADIDELITRAQQSGLNISMETTGDVVPLDPSLEHAVYRVVQEGLSNAMKHAGDGAKVEIIQRWEPHQLTVSVRSTSGVVPTKPVSGGFGLVGLRERIGVTGGTMHHGPTPSGYLLQATLPTTQAHPRITALRDER